MTGFYMKRNTGVKWVTLKCSENAPLGVAEKMTETKLKNL